MPTARQLLSVWLHMHGLSFTQKSWAKFLVFISIVFTWHLPRVTSTTLWSKFVLPVDSLPLMICRQQEVSCHACFNFIRLSSGSPMLNSGNRPLPTEYRSLIFVILKFNHAHLNLRCMAASNQTSTYVHIHTHLCNAVLLEWACSGSPQWHSL